MVNRNLSFWLNFHDFNNLIFTHQLTQIIFKPTNLRPLVSKRLIILPTNFRCTASGLSKSSVRSVSSLVFGSDSSAIHKCLNYLGRWLIISDLILHIFVLETGGCGSDPTANPSWWWEIKDAFIGMTLLGILAAISHKIGTKFHWNSKITQIFGEINMLQKWRVRKWNFTSTWINKNAYNDKYTDFMQHFPNIRHLFHLFRNCYSNWITKTGDWLSGSLELIWKNSNWWFEQKVIQIEAQDVDYGESKKTTTCFM